MTNNFPLEICVLGCGTSTGVPVIGCTCPVCNSNNPKNKRDRSSIMITSARGERIVIDTGPEFRLQMIREKVLDINAVIYSHTHADHTRGFDDLRAFNFKSKKPISCYVPIEHLEELKHNFSYAFEETDYIGSKMLIESKTLTKGTFKINDLQFDSIIMPHGNTTSRAYKIGHFVYATDFKTFPEKAKKKWKGSIDVMIASGVYFSSLPTHSSIQETLELFKELEVKKGIITHLSHRVDYDRDSSLLPENIVFAYDGMKFKVT